MVNPSREGKIDDDTSLQKRFQNVVRGVVVYLQARHQLFLIEAREAAAFLSNRLVLALVAFVFLACGYALLLVAAIILFSQWSGLPWPYVCLLASALHLVVGYLFVRLAQRPPREPLFEESVKELEKDREWLANSKKP